MVNLLETFFVWVSASPALAGRMLACPNSVTLHRTDVDCTSIVIAGVMSFLFNCSMDPACGYQETMEGRFSVHHAS